MPISLPVPDAPGAVLGVRGAPQDGLAGALGDGAGAVFAQAGGRVSFGGE